MSDGFGQRRQSDAAPSDFDGISAESDGHGPGRSGAVVRTHPETGERHLDNLVWGLLPFGTKDPVTAPRPIHARAETVAQHPMFAAAYRKRRAIVPASVYFQRPTRGSARWRFRIARCDGQPMAFAGLWESYRWPDGEITRTYCVITTAANALISPIHDRMPVILEEPDWPLWLGEVDGDPASLLRPAREDVLKCAPMRSGRSDRSR